MLGGILAIITGLGPTVLSLGGKIADYKIQKNNTESQREKNKIDQQIEEAHVRRDMYVAEAGNRVAVIMKGIARGLIIAGPVSVLLKITLWDKVVASFNGCAGRFAASHMADCSSFVTDTIDPIAWTVMAGAIAFYLGYDMLAISRKN